MSDTVSNTPLVRNLRDLLIISKTDETILFATLTIAKQKLDMRLFSSHRLNRSNIGLLDYWFCKISYDVAVIYGTAFMENLQKKHLQWTFLSTTEDSGP